MPRLLLQRVLHFLDLGAAFELVAVSIAAARPIQAFVGVALPPLLISQRGPDEVLTALHP